MLKYLTLLSLPFILLLEPVYGQTACPGETIFEEEEGLLVIEMESLPLTGQWTLDSVKSGYTGRGYIYWAGGQFFGETGNGQMQLDFKINTPGTYKFTWRMAVGLGQAVSEHNDTWLKISASNFYGRKGNGHLVKPRPDCDDDPNADCPNGSSKNGFFKVWGQSTNFIWASYTSDNDAHVIFATFDTAGVYSMTLAARSSWCMMDRMVLQLEGSVSDAEARNLNTPQSACTTRTTSLASLWQQPALSVFPNPATNRLTITGMQEAAAYQILDLAGRNLQSGRLSRDGLLSLSPELPTGLYLIRINGRSGRFMKH